MKKVDRKWSAEEDALLLAEYKQYGDARRLRSLLKNRSEAAIIKRANGLGITTRRATGMPYSVGELRSMTFADVNGCWNWTGEKRPKGYGVVIHAGEKIAAHRLMFALTYPDISITGRLVCHHCDNPACINPGHLYAGTYTDNNRDTVRRGRYRNQYGGLKRASSHGGC